MNESPPLHVLHIATTTDCTTTDTVAEEKDKEEKEEAKDYALLCDALKIKSNLEQASIEEYNQIIQQIPKQIIISSLFQTCQPYPTKNNSYKRSTLNNITHTINTVNNEYQMICNCSKSINSAEKLQLCNRTDGKCSAFYHQNCPQCENGLCVKCTLQKKRKMKQTVKFLNNNNNNNIIFDLISHCIDTLQCITIFLTFRDYTFLKITCSLLYQHLVHSSARFGLYSIIELSPYKVRWLSQAKAAFNHFCNYIQHLDVTLHSYNSPCWDFYGKKKLKKVISITIFGENRSWTHLDKKLTNRLNKFIDYQNLEKIELGEIRIPFDHIMSYNFWANSLLSSRKISHIELFDITISKITDEKLQHNFMSNNNHYKDKFHKLCLLFHSVKCLKLCNIKPFKMMYYLLLIFEKTISTLSIDFYPNYNLEPLQYYIASPKKLSYSFQNLISLELYSHFLNYEKFKTMFCSCLKHLKHIHIRCHPEELLKLIDDPTDYNDTKTTQPKSHESDIHLLLLFEAPSLISMQLDAPMTNEQFAILSQHIHQKKHTVLQSIKIQLYLFDYLHSPHLLKNDQNEDDEDNNYYVTNYYCILQNIKLLIMSFRNYKLNQQWNITIDFGYDSWIFMDKFFNINHDDDNNNDLKLKEQWENTLQKAIEQQMKAMNRSNYSMTFKEDEESRNPILSLFYSGDNIGI